MTQRTWQALILAMHELLCLSIYSLYTLRWHHNEHDGVPNHRRLDCLLNRLFRCWSKKTPKLGVTLCWESTGHRWFPSQRAGNMENIPFDVIIMNPIMMNSHKSHAMPAREGGVLGIPCEALFWSISRTCHFEVVYDITLSYPVLKEVPLFMSHYLCNEPVDSYLWGKRVPPIFLYSCNEMFYIVTGTGWHRFAMWSYYMFPFVLIAQRWWSYLGSRWKVHVFFRINPTSGRRLHWLHDLLRIEGQQCGTFSILKLWTKIIRLN